MYGQPFAKITGDTLNDRIHRGSLPDEKDRLKSTTGINFTHPKGEDCEFSNTLKMSGQNVLNGTSTKKFTSVEDFEIPPIDRTPISGYQGYRPTYRNPVKKLYQTQPEGFQTTKYADQTTKVADGQLGYVLNHTEARLDMNRPVPAVGYTGFVQGQKAKNVYGRNYQNIVIESKLTH